MARITSDLGQGIKSNSSSSTVQSILLPSDQVMDDLQESDFSLSAWYFPYSYPSSSGFDQSHGLVIKRGWHFGLAMEQPRENYGQNKLLVHRPQSLSPISRILQLSNEWVHALMVVSWEEGRLKIFADGELSQNYFFGTQHNTQGNEFQSMVDWFIDSC